LLIGLARCGINEDDNNSSARFFGGLNHDIQNILDYKEWRNFFQLYHLTIKAEREVQGRKQHQPFRSKHVQTLHIYSMWHRVHKPDFKTGM
jgi:hypothetical protein